MLRQEAEILQLFELYQTILSEISEIQEEIFAEWLLPFQVKEELFVTRDDLNLSNQGKKNLKKL